MLRLVSVFLLLYIHLSDSMIPEIFEGMNAKISVIDIDIYMPTISFWHFYFILFLFIFVYVHNRMLQRGNTEF